MVSNRFYGRIAERTDCHEDSTLKAIKFSAHGLGKISGERIWSELRRILEGNFAGDLMKTMLSLGIGPHIGKLDLK
jgi:tRNA nucleotidyltransferase (CCA-adding enzyme)